MIKRNLKIFLLLCFLCAECCVQAQSKKKLYKEAEAAIENKDYENAVYYYHSLLLRDSFNTEYQYKLANAARLNYQLDLSYYWYKKVYSEHPKEYPDVIFYLGLLLKNKGEYKEAIKYLEKFHKKYKNVKNNSEYKKMAVLAKEHIVGCEDALISMQQPLPIKIIHADTIINTVLSEYAPFMYDSLFYFSSLRKQKNDSAWSMMYVSLYQHDSLKKPSALPLFFNQQDVHNANLCRYKEFIFFTRCAPINASEFECKIYYSKYINNHWTSPELLPPEINHPRYTTTHPFATKWQNKNVLFFSSNRPNGEGGIDVWYAFFDNQLEFEKPINAGKNINTTYDEITPCFDAKKNILYFSSNHPKGFGGFDIFQSYSNKNAFAMPQNIGYPISTSYNDVYFNISKNRKTAFLSSNRNGSYFEKSPNCCNDIYYYFTHDSLADKDSVPKLPSQKDTILQTFNKMKLLVPLTLYFHNDEPDPKTKNITTDKNYKTTCDLYLKMLNEYITEYSKGLKGDDKERAINLVQGFFEDSVEAGFNNLEKFTAYLEDLMKEKQTVKIIMKGYCSPLASTDYNVNLAKRRISSLRNFFYQYKNGYFMQFINNVTDDTKGKIIMKDEDIGELPFSKVSDNLKDKRNSVYSPYAAAERKIQIIAIQLE